MRNISGVIPAGTGPRHPKRRFHTGWLLAFVIPLLLVAGILFVISKLLYGVEYYSPTVELEKYVEAIRTKDYPRAMEMLGVGETPFNGSEEYAAFFEEYYGGKVEKYVFVERKLQETDKDVFYDVRINKTASDKFRLTKTGVKRLYVFDAWELSLVGELPTRSVVIHAIPGVKLTLNGVPVGIEYRLPEPGYTLDFYKTIKDDSRELAVESYRIDGLIAVSSLKARNDYGEECAVTLLEDKDGVSSYLVNAPIPAAQAEELKAAALEITKKYSLFIAKDITFSQLTPYLYKNTLFYDNLREFYNGWFTGHDSNGFEKVDYFGMEWFDDTHCRIGIEMNFYVYKGEKRFDYPIKYNVFLLKVGNKWLLADLSIQ